MEKMQKDQGSDPAGSCENRMETARDREQRLAKQKKWLARQKRRAEMEKARKQAEDQAKTLRLSEDQHFMRAALLEAGKAAALGEVPIGCVIVKDREIISRGYNRRNTDVCTLSHAELNAIRDASRILGDWRLEGCTIYITLEPCQMCSGAIVQARIPRCVIGAMNPKAGCAGSVLNLLQVPRFNHQTEITSGVLEEECSRQLSAFFEELRRRKKA